MRTYDDPTVNSIETYLSFLIEVDQTIVENVSNIAKLNKRKNEEYREILEKIDYWHFIQSADYHYFISRILYLHHIGEYSQFCGYQCIDNYLKAFLKYKNQVPPSSHDLQKLLELCRSEEHTADSFINNDYISIIIEKYIPFYELARYPVQKKLPKDGYSFLFPDDIYILDYFVMKMRETLTIPSNTWDILVKGHYRLFLCQEKFPDFYKSFLMNNINFIKK